MSNEREDGLTIARILRDRGLRFVLAVIATECGRLGRVLAGVATPTAQQESRKWLGVELTLRQTGRQTLPGELTGEEA